MTSDEMKEVFANAPVGKTDFEAITISAPWFSQEYHLQNVVTEPIDVVDENDQTITLEYAPMSIGKSSNNADLNNERTIVIQEVNDIIASEQDKFDPDIHDPRDAKVTVRGYIYYRNGDVSSLQTSPVTVTVRDFTSETENSATSIRAASKPANQSATGERATIQRVPMLRGFL